MTLALAILCLVQFAAIVRLAWFAWRQWKSKLAVGNVCFLLWQYNEHLLDELDVQDAVFIERAKTMHQRFSKPAGWN